jgi:hypothetical protein
MGIVVVMLTIRFDFLSGISVTFSSHFPRFHERSTSPFGVLIECYGFFPFLRRLARVRTVKPMMIPASMDSHGNPGMGGKANGVEAELELTVDVV